MRKFSMTAALVAALYANAETQGGHPRRKEKPLRPCLHCGTPHDHNNSFCSASCCRNHKESGDHRE